MIRSVACFGSVLLLIIPVHVCVDYIGFYLFIYFIYFIYTMFLEGNAFSCYSYSTLRPSMQTYLHIYKQYIYIMEN